METLYIKVGDRIGVVQVSSNLLTQCAHKQSEGACTAEFLSPKGQVDNRCAVCLGLQVQTGSEQ